MKKLSGKFVPSHIPSLNVNDNVVLYPEKVASLLDNHFSDISGGNNHSDYFLANVSKLPVDFSSDNDEANIVAPYASSWQ